MDSLTLAQELKRFLKENKKSILIITLIIMVMMIGVSIFSGKIQDRLNTQKEKDIELVSPAVFQFYVQNADGNSFHNSAVVEAFFLQPEVVDLIEKNTGVEIQEVLDEQQESGFIKTQTDRGVLGVARDGSSHVFTVNADLGTSEENLAVMGAYFDYLLSGEVAVLSDKEVFILQKPVLLDELPGSEENISVNKEVDTSFSAKNVLVSAGIGLFGGLIAGLFLTLIYQLFRKAITYAFSFSWSEDDIYQIYSLSNTELEASSTFKQTLLHPFTDVKVILTQTKIDDSFISQFAISDKINIINSLSDLKKEHMNLIMLTDLTQIDPLLSINECIVLVKSGETDKRWYSRQRELLKNYDTQIKVIQLIP